MSEEGKREGHRSLKPGRKILSRTLILMAVCGIAAFAILIARLWKLMIVDHDVYESLAIEQQTLETTVKALRGTVYDRNGNALAISATAYNVFLSPNELRSYLKEAESPMPLETIAERLEEILGVDRSVILKKAAVTDSLYEVVARQVEADTSDRIRALIDESGIRGIYLEETSRRYYPYSNLACHLIGFVGTDGYGLAGLEAEYDEYLTGTDGNVVRLANAMGREMLFSNYEYYYDAVDGDSVTLSLDVSAQYIVEKYLDQAIADYDVQKGGCCIVMNVNTGSILAMASRNDFDLNSAWTLNGDTQARLDQILNPDPSAAVTFGPEGETQTDEALQEQIAQYLAMSQEERQTAYDDAYSQALYDQWRNRAVSDTYEPGSVFKSVVLSMALDEGVVTRDSSFTCGGSMAVLGRGDDNPLHCWKRSGHGTQSLAEAVQNSCNVAFASIGLLVGPETFYEYVRAFGLFDTTGIDLPGEGGSVWWTEDVFCDPTNRSQLASASFGQTFNITPIQMITAFSSAVNGGYLLEPYVVERITDAEGDTVLQRERAEVRQVISSQTSQTVREILESVVSEGTGGNAAVAGFRIGGKTGTSEKVAQDAAGAEKEYMVSFCGFAPADNPEIAVLLILDTPSDETGIYISGGNMGAPTVGSMFSELLPYLGYQPEYTPEEAALVDVRLPKLVGKTLTEAMEELESLGLGVEIVGEADTVTGQLPRANCEIAAGSSVILYAGVEASSEETTVPDLYGLSVEDAVLRLSWYGLYLETTGASPTNPAAVVSKQSCPEGETVTVGTILTVTLTDQSNLGVY